MRFRPTDDKKRVELKDGRMRYEKSHPMHFTTAPSEAYSKGYDGIDWSDGRPNQAKARKHAPRIEGEHVLGDARNGDWKLEPKK